jgi:hypothetical protein
MPVAFLANRSARHGAPVRVVCRGRSDVVRAAESALIAGLCGLVCAGAAAAAGPPPQADHLYQVMPGDTLIGIAGRLLEPPDRWRDLQRHNAVRAPTRLAPGSTLRIPQQWLRGDPSTLSVGEAGGAATLDGRPAVAGASGGEGSRIETGTDGVVVVRLRDGTLLTIPPASSVRFLRLREYLGPDAVEVRIGVERGALDTRSAPMRRRPLDIRTPTVTAAVRGTEFRVRARERDTAVEVLTGAVAAGSAAGAADLGAGQGAIASADRPPQIERLLDAPVLDGMTPRIETVAATLAFTPVPGAAAYRVQVADDAGFTRLLSDRSQATPEVTLVSRIDGRLHLRVRAVSAIGLEGREALATVEVAARPEPPLPVRPPERAVLFDGSVSLAWAKPDGIAAYRVQVAASADFARPVHDSVGAEPIRSIELPPLAGPSADWWWRVAAIAGTGADAKQGPFSTPRAFEQRRVGGAPAGVVDDSRLDLSWPPLPGHRYRLQLAADAAFTALLLERELAEPRTSITDLQPGTYFTRTQSIDAQGVTSPFGPPQRFEIPFLLRGGSGAPVGSGSGVPVELQAPR